MESILGNKAPKHPFSFGIFQFTPSDDDRLGKTRLCPRTLSVYEQST